MKFGNSLFRLSVPKWASYNLNYNELKHLIKLRTSSAGGAPVPIPGSTDHRWSILEDELFGILREQYDNIALFIRSKQGELERRLLHLEKSVRGTRRSASLYSGRPSAQARKYQKLLQEAENIGEDIQALSRFAAVQRTAFRKILKKYNKWTSNETLRKRLDKEVFCDGQLDLNLTDQAQQLAAVTATIKNLEEKLLDSDGQSHASVRTDSTAASITKASISGILHFDAAFSSTPFGESAGTATYWIHPDNIQEARLLLFRHMKILEAQATLSRANSVDSNFSGKSGSSGQPAVCQTNVAFFDNPHRYVQDTSRHSPSRAALQARWATRLKESLVTMADMSPRSDYTWTVPIKKKELAQVLNREDAISKEKTAHAANLNIVKDFLSQHRDVKPLGVLESNRTRFVGLNNSAEAGTFAALDTDIVFSAFDKELVVNTDAERINSSTFIHAVLEIRWEFGRKPEIVRALDTTHLAERVPNFSLESATIGSQNSEAANFSWKSLLEKDIRKLPVHQRSARRNEIQIGSSSGPSSTDAPASIFSTRERSGGSDTSPMESMHNLPSQIQNAEMKPKPKQKRARIESTPPKQSSRYYSEYDDPESEFNQQEAYTIYVDPNEEAPGVATIRKVSHALQSLFIRPHGNKSERAPLLSSPTINEDDEASSDDESDGIQKPKHKGIPGYVRPSEVYKERLSRRQRQFETTLIIFYSGLLVLSYIFLLMSGILLTTGRKKEVLEVDVGATVGVCVSFITTSLAMALVFMRKTRLSGIEKITLFLADTMIIVLGAAVVAGIVQRAQGSK